MNFKKLLLLLILIVFNSLNVLMAFKANQDSLSHEIKIKSLIYDAGMVKPGKKVKAIFTVENKGTKVLKILRLTPTCGCTVAEYNKVIQPGQEGQIFATMSTLKYRGKIDKTIIVVFNDPQRSEVILHIKCDIMGVRLLPVNRTYFNASKGVKTTKELTLATIGEDSLTVFVRSSHPNIETQLVKLENEIITMNESDYWEQYKLYITISDKFPEGRFSESVTLVTNSQYDPSIKITVAGVVNPAIIVTPRSVRMQKNQEGKMLPRFVTVTQRVGKGFKIKKIISSLSQLNITYAETKKDEQYKLELEWTDHNTKGTFKGDVTIYTNDSRNPVLNIPVYIII